MKIQRPREVVVFPLIFVCFACMYLCTMWVQCLWRQEQLTGVTEL